MSSIELMNSVRISSKNRYQILPYDKICRLHKVLDQKLSFVSNIPGLPTINVNFKQFLQQIRRNFENLNVKIDDIRLNGGAASYVIASDNVPLYNDLDLIISLDSCNGTDDLQNIRSAVLNAIVKNNHQSIHNKIIPESYIQKQVRVQDSSNGDLWSLISLGSNYGGNRVFELKLVYTMRRKYEFSVDSFQIKLDSLLTFFDRGFEISCHFYPTVVAESVWGSFQEARRHLNEKMIVTEKPEEIRGGGLLKYCKLLIEGYITDDNIDVISLERYMCSRFFIDFPDIEKQKNKLVSYLINHFTDDSKVRITFLKTLQMVVSNSTVCLMNHERYQTLTLIKTLIHNVWNCSQTPLHIEVFNDPEQWVLDHIFYGTTCGLTPANGVVSYPTSGVHTPSDHSPTDLMLSPNFLDQ